MPTADGINVHRFHALQDAICNEEILSTIEKRLGYCLIPGKTYVETHLLCYQGSSQIRGGVPSGRSEKE